MFTTMNERMEQKTAETVVGVMSISVSVKLEAHEYVREVKARNGRVVRQNPDPKSAVVCLELTSPTLSRYACETGLFMGSVRLFSDMEASEQVADIVRFVRLINSKGVPMMASDILATLGALNDYWAERVRSNEFTAIL